MITPSALPKAYAQTLTILVRLSKKTPAVVERAILKARQVNARGGNGLQVIKAVASILGLKHEPFNDQVGDTLQVGKRILIIMGVSRHEVVLRGSSPDYGDYVIPATYPLLCHLK